MAMVESLEARGYIDRAQSLKLLDFPDIDAEMSLELAPMELIDERIQKIIDGDEYLAPHPRMDLDMALKRSMLAYQRGEQRGLPEDKLDRLGQFIDAISELQAKAAPAAAPVDPMAMGGEVDPMTGEPLAAAGGMPGDPGMPPDAAMMPVDPLAAAAPAAPPVG
jgi:hypothetical protein